MAMRSWLFVPGDSQPKLDKAPTCGADVVIVDLEDAVAPPAKPQARMTTRDWLERWALRPGAFARWVRINALDTQLWREDLAAVMSGRPDGIVVPKAAGPEQLQALAGELSVQEQRNGIAAGATSAASGWTRSASSARRSCSLRMPAACSRSTRFTPSSATSRASSGSRPSPIPKASPGCWRSIRAKCR